MRRTYIGCSSCLACFQQGGVVVDAEPAPEPVYDRASVGTTGWKVATSFGFYDGIPQGKKDKLGSYKYPIYSSVNRKRAWVLVGEVSPCSVDFKSTLRVATATAAGRDVGGDSGLNGSLS